MDLFEIWKANMRPSWHLTWPVFQRSWRCEILFTAGFQYPFSSFLGVNSVAEEAASWSRLPVLGHVGEFTSFGGLEDSCSLSGPVLYFSGNYFWMFGLELNPSSPANNVVNTQFPILNSTLLKILRLVPLVLYCILMSQLSPRLILRTK